jgi:1-acyl-sn-glycerol-3-phosphate acyltransferase
MIPVDRSAGLSALTKMTARARQELERGCKLVIFPEGTRRLPGAEPVYKPGIAFLYSQTNVPCVPIALNSGLFWPRRTFMRYPGTLVVEFLDPLPPGLSRREFVTRVSAVIEDASQRLVETARREQAQLFGRVPGPRAAKA